MNVPATLISDRPEPMNYDETDIPAGYDRARDHGPENVALWMGVVSSYVEKGRVNTVLDLGCGTGRYSAGLAEHFGAVVVGADPSAKMLEQARAKKQMRVLHILAAAEALPLADASVDLVFMSMVFHHFKDPAAAACEIGRVLRAGGTAFLRAGVTERISSYPYVEFFPGSAPIIEGLLSSRAFMRETFERAGFLTEASDVVTQTIAPSYAAYARKLAACGDSVLSQLPPDEFEAGLSGVRRHARSAGETPVHEPIDFFVFRCAGGEG